MNVIPQCFDGQLDELRIYNCTFSVSQEVRTPASGKYTITWDGKDNNGHILPSGVYLYKLRVNGFAQTRKMTFMK